MKNKYIKILIVLLGLSTFSCSKLEESPIGIFAPESFFKTEKDVQSMINGCYGYFASEFLFGRTFMLALDLSSDMADIGDVGTAAKRVQINNFSMDATNADSANIWYYLYNVISNANTAIYGAEKINAPEDKKNVLIAEAKTIRALAYYHLVQLFGDVPLIVDFVSSSAKVSKIARTPQNEVWNQIIEDAKFGAHYLPVSYASGTSRPTMAAAKVLLASSYLTIGDWTSAAKYAEEIIANENDFGLSLMNDYQDQFNAAKKSTETIWAVDFKGGISSGLFQVDFYPPTTGIRGSDDLGWSVIVASSTKLYDSFDDKDYRKEVIFQPGQYHNGIWKDWTQFVWPRIHYAKWRRFIGNTGVKDGGSSDNNYPFFRYAEVLLIAAEALNEANGPSAKAYEYINRVRTRARFNGKINTDFPANLSMGLSKDDFRKAVREERRVELAFEWKRWYDIKRWDDGDITKYFNQADSYENEPKVQKFHKFYPIPQTERDLNPNLSQNDGY